VNNTRMFLFQNRTKQKLKVANDIENETVVTFMLKCGIKLCGIIKAIDDDGITIYNPIYVESSKSFLDDCIENSFKLKHNDFYYLSPAKENLSKQYMNDSNSI